jgi:hypothetical protein
MTDDTRGEQPKVTRVVPVLYDKGRITLDEIDKDIL